MVNVSAYSLLSLVALNAVAAIDCSIPELSKFNLNLLKGSHKQTSEKETPPTTTKETWYFGVCAPVEEKLCAEDADICGVTEVLIDKKYAVTQVMNFGSKSSKKVYTPLSDDKGVKISYEGTQWGSETLSAEINFLCATSDTPKESLDIFRVTSFKDGNLIAEVVSAAGCVKKDGDKNGDGNKGDKEKTPKKDDKGESWGWFTWIFIFLVLFLSIYIIGGAWFQYHKSNSIDFQSALREVLENFIDLLRGLPQFIKEIVEKVTGNNTRGEYSAV